jgi:predicted RND superfamily exporter protein
VFSPVQSIVVWAYRRRWVVVCGGLILIAASALGVRGVRFDTDVISLLPRDGRAIPAFRTFLKRFGSLDQVLIVFTAPEGKGIGAYDREVQAWATALRASPEIDWVDTGAPGPDRDWSWLADHQLLLMRGRTLDTALRRFGPEGMSAALASARQLLAVPSPDVEQLVRQDPLDLFGLLRHQFGGARAGMPIGINPNGYLSVDGRRRLLIVKPRRPPFDTAFSRALSDRLSRLRTDLSTGSATGNGDGAGPLSVDFVGGHFIAIETEALVKRESISNSVGSLVLILPLLLVVFRSLWLFLFGALPSLLSLLVVLGLMGIAHTTLSAAATGAAAMLFGLGVDGVVLLYVAHRLAIAGGQRGPGAVAAIGSPAVSMLLGMFTTAATFYGLVWVDFPSLQQLGLLIGNAMVACGLLTLVLVPAFLPRGSTLQTRRWSLEWPAFAGWVAKRRRVILAGSMLLTLALGLAAVRLRVNPSLERLKSTTPAVAREAEIQHLFGLPSDVYVVLQEGTDLERLLEANERIVAELGAAAPALIIDAPSAIVPSIATQTRVAEQIRRAVPAAGAAIAGLDKASAVAGFREGSFDPFRGRLPRLLSPDRLTVDGYREHGLADIVGRFVVSGANGWALASYAFPATPADAATLEHIVAREGNARLTGLALVNRELAERFVPQFLRGLGIGTVVVVILIAVTFRDWRLSALAMVPTFLGLVWAAGILALADVSLDLFAVFAVVSFIGIGVDYGIHMIHRYQDHGDAAAAVAQLAPVILVAGLVTLGGYGTLVTSDYPPLRSMGIVSLVSVATLVAASVVTLPALLLRGAAVRTGTSVHQ